MSSLPVRLSFLLFLLQPPNFQFHDPQGPIYTSPRFLPPAKVRMTASCLETPHLHCNRKRRSGPGLSKAAVRAGCAV